MVIQEPLLLRRRDSLKLEQAQYWKDLLYRTVKVGTELEFAAPKGTSKDVLLESLCAAMQPTGDITRQGRHGVLAVQSEHCGIEVQILGRQPYYPALLEQYREILSLLPEGVRTRPTCGLHYHLLTVGQSEPMPEIILANLWNLTRRYAPELRFLTSAGDSLSAMCRRRNYTSHLEMVRLSPTGRTMREIAQILHESRTVPEHQNFLNLEHVSFADDGAVQSFHVELRFPDADLACTSLVAKAFLFLAMLLKAVELSQYGLIHVGQIGPWLRRRQLLDLLSNNEGPLATSDTSRITPEIIDELRVGCRELLELLKPVFDRFERNPSFEIQSLLAETPLSLLRVGGRSWSEVEQLLGERAATPTRDLSAADVGLMRLIELAEVTSAPAEETWKKLAARELLVTPQEIDSCLAKLDRLRGVRWDPRLGSMVLAS